MWGRALAAASVVLAVFLAGCVGGFGGDARHVCYNGDAGAVWTEPGLFFALTGAAADAGLMPEGRYGFDERGLVPGREWDAGTWATDAWTAITYRDAATGMRVHLSAHEPGHYLVSVRGSGHDAGALPPFRAFMSALGLGDAPDLPVWERGLLSTAGQGAYLDVNLMAEPDFAGLHARVTQGAPEVLPGGNGGNSGLVWGDWTFHYRLGSFAYVVPLDDGSSVRLQVAEDDRVVASSAVGATNTPWPDLQARVEAAFAAVGLPEPTYEDLGRRPPNCEEYR